MITKAKGARGKADKLFSQLVRSVGRCRKCGSTDYGKLQCAHIISRRYSATRVDPANALCLCASCHFHFTGNPDEWMSFLASEIGTGEFLRLKQKALEGAKVDWPAECERLKRLLAILEEDDHAGVTAQDVLYRMRYG